MDNDGVLSLPCDRVFQLLRESFSVHCYLFLPSHSLSDTPDGIPP